MTRHQGHRRSIRLPIYDYSSTGAYFVTICVQNRACVFGEIDQTGVALSQVGQMVESWWCTIGGRFPTVSIDAYVLMPNHLHGLLGFGWDVVESTGPAGTEKGRHRGLSLQKTSPTPTTSIESAPPDRRGKPPCLPSSSTTNADPEQPAEPTLGRVIQWFKSATTRDYAVGVDLLGWPPYPGRLWQRNYYEHIVRNEAELDRIRAYIDGNPGRWAEDEEHRDICPGFG